MFRAEPCLEVAGDCEVRYGEACSYAKGRVLWGKEKTLSWSVHCLWATCIFSVGLVGSRNMMRAVIYVGRGQGVAHLEKRPFQKVGISGEWILACEWQMPVMMA